MNIAILVDTLAVGGAERQAILCVSELRKLGHSVDLIHYHPVKEYGPMLECLGIDPIYVNGKTFLQRCRRLRRLFRERDYDVIHGFKMAAEVYAAVAGTWARVPHRFGSFRSIYDLGFRHCILHFVVDKFLEAWIVNSKCGAESMARHTRISPRKIQVLHNGVLNEMFHPVITPEEARARIGLPKDSRVVTMIARLQPGKNHRMFIDAARAVLLDRAEVYFLIVGAGPLRNDLERYAADCGVSANVVFLGLRTDVPDILAATDVSALTTDVEGLPNTIIESMAAGKAIACTRYSGWDEIMADGENALISDCGDARAFAANVLRLLRDDTLRAGLAKEGRAYARRHFAPEAMARKLEAVYTGQALKSHVDCRSTRAHAA
jgi:glycosyltransferase involved in cell wall biosynthesis